MKNVDALLVIVVLLGFASWVLFELMSSSSEQDEKENKPKKVTPSKKRKVKDKKNRGL